MDNKHTIRSKTGVKIDSSQFSVVEPISTSGSIDRLVISGSNIQLSGSVSISGSLFATASWATNALTSSFITTLNQPVIVSGSFTIFTGSAVEFQVTNTGVKIGNNINDTHNITGSVNISGSIKLNNSNISPTAGNLYLYYNY